MLWLVVVQVVFFGRQAHKIVEWHHWVIQVARQACEDRLAQWQLIPGHHTLRVRQYCDGTNVVTMLSFARQAYEDTDLPSDNRYQVITPYRSDSIVMVQVVLLNRQVHEDTDSHQLGASDNTRPFHRLGQTVLCLVWLWYEWRLLPNKLIKSYSQSSVRWSLRAKFAFALLDDIVVVGAIMSWQFEDITVTCLQCCRLH